MVFHGLPSWLSVAACWGSARLTTPQSQSLQPLRTLFCLSLISHLSDSFHLFSAQTPKKHSLVWPGLRTQTKFSKLGMILLVILLFLDGCMFAKHILSCCLYLFIYFTYPQHPFDHLQAGFYLGRSTKVSSLEVPVKTQFLCTMVGSHSRPPRPFYSLLHCWPSLPLEYLYHGHPRECIATFYFSEFSISVSLTSPKYLLHLYTLSL